MIFLKIYIHDEGTEGSRKEKHDKALKILFDKVKKDFNEEIDISKIKLNKNKKPYFDKSNIYFNFSYSNSLIVVGLGSEDLGIDVEKIKVCDYKVVNRFYSDKEKRFIYNSKNKNYDYIKLWTIKEAYLKYIGTGINSSFCKLNFIENSNYTNDKKIHSYDLGDYIITIVTKESEIEVEVV